MSFGLLSSILTFIFWFTSWIIFPGVLSMKEYIFGVVLCFIAAKTFASKSGTTAGGRSILALLIPGYGVFMLCYGLYLKFGAESETLRPDDVEIVSSAGELLPSALMLGGACVLIICGYVFYNSWSKR